MPAGKMELLQRVFLGGRGGELSLLLERPPPKVLPFSVTSTAVALSFVFHYPRTGLGSGRETAASCVSHWIAQSWLQTRQAVGSSGRQRGLGKEVGWTPVVRDPVPEFSAQPRFFPQGSHTQPSADSQTVVGAGSGQAPHVFLWSP